MAYKNYVNKKQKVNNKGYSTKKVHPKRCTIFYKTIGLLCHFEANPYTIIAFGNTTNSTKGRIST